MSTNTQRDMSLRLARHSALAILVVFLAGACASAPKTLGQTAWDRKVGTVDVVVVPHVNGVTADTVKRALSEKLAAEGLMDPRSATRLHVEVQQFPSDAELAASAAGSTQFASESTVDSLGTPFAFPVYRLGGAGRQPPPASERLDAMTRGIAASLVIESRIKR